VSDVNVREEELRECINNQKKISDLAKDLYKKVEGADFKRKPYHSGHQKIKAISMKNA
jgi:hypothetical protein